jgi:uncharacterized membrane-anchored protein YhcB (DUF1043 family)
MKISTDKKKHIKNASIFILGVIVTIIITKLSDKIVPNEPVIVKQFTDTIKVIHDYKLPERIDNDTIKSELVKKIKNLELLNNYDKQIKERLSLLDSSSNLIPNLILTQNLSSLSHKGYTYASSSSYFSSDCPDLNSKFIDIKINFLNPEIVKEIAFLRVNIYKTSNEKSNQPSNFILEEFYEVKPNNLIRINNDLSSGRYEILYGFMFKNDLNNKYPDFHFKKCYSNKI